MSYPIPVLDEHSAAAKLSRLYLEYQRSSSKLGTTPTLLVTLPTAWANKYQILLYRHSAEHGFAVAGVTHPRDLRHVEWPGPVILHAHWFAALFAGAENPHEAADALKAIKTEIAQFLERTGAKLLWTAHNTFPHGNAHPQTFLELRQWVLETASAVHVMDDAHIEVLEDAFNAKAPNPVTVPHMLYTGAQPQGITRHAARAQFGIPHDAIVFGFFGSIQKYKQIPQIVKSLDTISSERPIFALIGGIPVDKEAVRELQVEIGLRQDVRLMARTIQDHEIQFLHEAADAMVLPYAETLNSGAAMMAATFRRPFILPFGPAFDALKGLGAAGYHASDPANLGRAMQSFADGSARVDIDESVWAGRHPSRISNRFFAALADI